MVYDAPTVAAMPHTGMWCQQCSLCQLLTMLEGWFDVPHYDIQNHSYRSQADV